jgi:mannitol/fructose-specific phosphotransferase system IIA component (Ntr-type)
MELKDVLDRNCVAAQVDASSKEQVLAEVARLAVQNPVLQDVPQTRILELLQEREAQGSTGFEGGVAIPHCSMDDIDGFAVGVVTTRDRIDFNAMDGNPSQLFFFIVGPKAQRSRHVSLLSAISKIVRSKESINRLLDTKSADELYQRTLESIVFRSEEAPPGPASMVHAFIQRDDLFEDILQIFSETTESSLFVDDVQDASAYLHELPLFSALWTESPNTTVKHIRAVVQKSHTNDVIRKISLIEDGIFETSGVMVAVQDLQYFTGSIEL